MNKPKADTLIVKLRQEQHAIEALRDRLQQIVNDAEDEMADIADAHDAIEDAIAALSRRH